MMKLLKPRFSKRMRGFVFAGDASSFQTQVTQISTSSPVKGHGVFTYHFLKALNSGKKILPEIYRYIKLLVEDNAKTLNIQQVR